MAKQGRTGFKNTHRVGKEKSREGGEKRRVGEERVIVGWRKEVIQQQGLSGMVMEGRYIMRRRRCLRNQEESVCVYRMR